MDRGAETPRIERTERFPGTSRVKARTDFVRLQSSSRRVHTPHFVVLLGVRDASRPDAPQGPRIGITVTRKIGCSVERNRVRRLVREVFRKNVELFPADQDIVVIARAGSPALGYATVLAEIEGARGAMRAVAERNRRSPPGPR